MSLPPYDQSMRDFERHYQVVLPDSVGQATLGFRDGSWFRLNSGTPHAVPIRSAIIICPHAAGSIVQIVCWWMRENTRSPRALDLATELALAVGELARKAIEDDPLGMSITTLPSPLPEQTGSAFGAAANYPGAPVGYPPANGYPAPAPAPAPSSYLAGAQMSAATTVLPQINPDAPMPSGRGMPGPAYGGPAGSVPRPSGPPPSMPALPGGPSGRGQHGPGGYPGQQQYPPRSGGGAPPPQHSGGPGPGRYGNSPDGRPSAPPPRRAAPYDQDEPVRQDQGRGEFFRDGAPPPPPRRPAQYGPPEQSWQGERNGERSGEYSRPPQRPRNEPRAW